MTPDLAGDDRPIARRWLRPLAAAVFVVLLMQAAARLIGPSLGAWSWVPLNVLYWTAALVLALAGGGRSGVRRWMGRSRRAGWWPAAVIGFAVLPTLPMLIPNARLFLRPEVWVTTLLFSAVNPVAEEFFWRGYLLDAMIGGGLRPAWAAVLSSLLFMANHQWIAVNVPGARNPVAMAFQLVFGLVMSAAYLRMRSLRWPLLGHVLINILTITSAVFLNLYIP